MSTRERVTELPLRSRTTFDGEGQVTRDESVHCPARGVALGVDACLECGYCARPPAEGDRTLGCLHPAARRRPRPAPAVRLPSEAELTPLHAIMTRDVVCVRPDLAVESLASLLLARHISAAPVVDAEGRPIGVVSKTDLVRWYHEDAGFADAAPPPVPLEPGLSPRAVRTTTVEDVMMPLAFTLSEDAPLVYAAALMTVEDIHHLPIVGAGGDVVGIVSALDLVRWMATRDGFVITPEGR
jgi:CBS domain-containing protein